MNHERRYRDKQSFPVPVWNGILEHRSRIDAAIWEFLWLVDAITEERDGMGIVFGGAPIKAKRIGADLAFDERTIRAHLDTLENGRYIRRRRTPYGYVFEVCNSRKFGIWQDHKRSEGNTRSNPTDRKKSPVRPEENTRSRPEEMARNKEDAAKGTQKKYAASSSRPISNSDQEDSVWGFLEISPCGPAKFRTMLEDSWATKNGKPSSALVGEVLDAWEGAEGRLPSVPRLFHALSKLRQQEKQAGRESVEAKPRERYELPPYRGWKSFKD